MSDSDIYNGFYLRRWSIDLATGREECLEDAVDIRTISSEEQEAIEAKNFDIHFAIEAVEAFESDPQVSVDPPVLALARLRAGEATDEDRATIADEWDYPVVVSPGPQAEAVNVERERRILAGSAFAVPGVGAVPLLGRPQDQSVYLALLIRAQAYKAALVTAPVLTIRDADNVNHALTPDQMIALVTAAMTWFESVMKVSWAMKDGEPPFQAGIPANFEDDSYWPA